MMSRSMSESTAATGTRAPGSRADCARCRHLRTAPVQARRTGCYHEKHMVQRQKDRPLDEQQIPGDHRAINRNGDCAEFEPARPRPSFWDWLFAAS
jgi:hypothetical protein